MNLFAAVIPRAAWMLDEFKVLLEPVSTLSIPFIDLEHDRVVWDNGHVLVCSYSIHADRTPIQRYASSDDRRLLTFNGIPVSRRLDRTDQPWPSELLEVHQQDPDFWERLGGYYCLLLADGPVVRACNCLSGVEPIYWASNADCTVIGNRASLVGCLANRRPRIDPSPEAIISLCTAGWPVTDAAPIEGVNLLPAGSLVTSEAGKVEVTTYKPYAFTEAEPVDDGELEERCESILTDLKDGLRLYGRFADSLKVNLTGGKDSRLIAALCKACDLDFTCTTSGGAADREVVVAAEVATLLGAPHTFTERRVQERAPEVDIIERLDGHLRQSEGCLNVFNPSFPIRTRASILVTGHAGECFRGGYARGPARAPVTDEASSLKFLDDLALHNSHLLMRADAVTAQKRINRDIHNQFLASGFPADNTHDYMYTRYRERRGQGGARQAAAFGAFSFSPFLDDRALSKSWTFPLDFRKNEWLLYNLMKGLDPKLAHLRFSDSRWKFEEDGPMPGASKSAWLSRAPIPPTPSRLAAHSWRLAYDGSMRATIRDYLLSDFASPIFEIVDAVKLESLLRRDGPTPQDVMGSVFGVLTAAYFLNGDWLPALRSSQPQDCSSASVSDSARFDDAVTREQGRIVSLETKLIETRNEIRYRLGEALVDCFHHPRSIPSLPKRVTSLFLEGLAKVKARRHAEPSARSPEAGRTAQALPRTARPAAAGGRGLSAVVSSETAASAGLRLLEVKDPGDWLAEVFPSLLGKAGRPVIDKHLLDSLHGSLEPNRTGGIDHWIYLREARADLSGTSLLDFGCGRGTSRPRVERLGLSWRGLDISDSPESLQRESDADVILYDGLEIPIGESSVDIVLSIQSLEHVANIMKTISELSRILKKGGKLVGSTSHLEPYHSMSTTNYTPLGFKNLLEEHGMRLVRIHPGIDALSLILRKLFKSLGEKEKGAATAGWFNDRSPLNAFLLDLAEREGLTARETNCLRLQFCGTFRFIAVKD